MLPEITATEGSPLLTPHLLLPTAALLELLELVARVALVAQVTVVVMAAMPATVAALRVMVAAVRAGTVALAVLEQALIQPLGHQDRVAAVVAAE